MSPLGYEKDALVPNPLALPEEPEPARVETAAVAKSTMRILLLERSATYKVAPSLLSPKPNGKVKDVATVDTCVVAKFIMRMRPFLESQM